MRTSGLTSEKLAIGFQRGDHSVIGLINSAGTLVSMYYYSPYGVLLTSDNYGTGGSLTSVDTVVNPIRFVAREYDSETGLYFMRARYYDPVAGRFISEDPLGAMAGANQYLYANADPVDFRDPGGLEAQQGEPCPEGWELKRNANGDVITDDKGTPQCQKKSGAQTLPSVVSKASRNRANDLGGLDPSIVSAVDWGGMLSTVKLGLLEFLERLTTPDPMSYSMFGKAASWKSIWRKSRPVAPLT